MNLKHARPFYSDPAVRVLELASKAVLIDALIDVLRTSDRAGCSCDDPVSVDEARKLVDRISAWPRTNGMGQMLRGVKP